MRPQFKHLLGLLFLNVLMVSPSLTQAQTAVALGPAPIATFLSSTGAPLSGCKIFTFAAGTSTPQPTFTDSSGLVQNANPTICDSAGRAQLWFSGLAYKITVENSSNVLQYTIDNFQIGVFAAGINSFTNTNTFNGTTNFNGPVNLNDGGSMNGTWSGNPAFSGSPTFQGTIVASVFQSTVATGTPPLIVASTTEVANLNVAALDGCVTTGTPSAGQVLQASSATACSWVTASQFPSVIYSTPSVSGHASLGATTMTTVGGSDATYNIQFYVQQTVAGTSCALNGSGTSTVAIGVIFTDPIATVTTALTPDFNLFTNGVGSIGISDSRLTLAVFSTIIRAKSGTDIQYSTTYTAGASCSPGGSYRIWPVLEQLTAN